VPTIPHIPTYARKYVAIYNLANDMMDIADDAPQHFIFTRIHDLDRDMWDDVESGITHLFPLILILAHRYPFKYYLGLGILSCNRRELEAFSCADCRTLPSQPNPFSLSKK
jgi:hypothetical protein